MTTWLNFLPIEIQDVEKLMEPTDEVKEGETIVGILSDNLKKLWTLSRSVKKSAELLSIELKYKQADVESAGEVSESLTKARALELIFWVEVFDELKMWGHPDQPGLRAGWQVVEYKRESTFPQLFGFGPPQ